MVRTVLLMLWSVLRNGLAAYGWAFAVYAVALVLHAVVGASGLWVLAPGALLAGLGATRWIWEGTTLPTRWRVVCVLCWAALLTGAARVGYAHGLVLAGQSEAAGLWTAAAGGRSLVVVPLGSVLRAFAVLLLWPVLILAAAGTALREAVGLPLATGADRPPTRPLDLLLDALELLVWLVATPAGFLAGANLGDNAYGTAQSVGLLVTVTAVPLGAYGFLRLLWAGITTRSLRTFARKAGLVVLLATVGALTLRAATPALDSLFAAAGVALLAVWLAAVGLMVLWRRRSTGRRRTDQDIRS